MAKIGKDKVKHALCSCAISIFLGLPAAMVAGFAWEANDKRHGGKIDTGDLLADLAGAVPGWALHLFLMWQCWH